MTDVNEVYAAAIREARRTGVLARSVNGSPLARLLGRAEADAVREQ
jgi:hypothetical protein